MKFLTLFVLSAGLATLAPMAAMATCYHGCIDYDVDINDGILVVDGEASECAACTGGAAYSYNIEIYPSGCETGFPSATKHFCTTVSSIPDSTWVFVESIGSGCDSTPNGCVRLCDCP